MIDETMWGRVAQCHVDAEDTECFLVGRIVWSNAQWVLMQLLAPHGRWDGIALLAQADYQAVEVDTPYCQKLVKVAALRGEDAPAVSGNGGRPAREDAESCTGASADGGTGNLRKRGG